MATNGTLDALYSEDAERAVIGSILIAPDTFGTLSARLDANDFFLLRHRILWEHAAKLDAAGKVIDLLTMGDALKAAGEKDIPPSYLLELVNNTPTHRNADAYADLVHRASVKRKVIQAADRMKELVTTGELPTEDVLDKALGFLTSMSALTVSDFHGMGDLVNAHMERTERAMEHPGLLAGVPSVLPGLGKLLGGYQPGRLYYVAARPGMGKTSFLVSEALHMALAGKRIAFASLEMMKDDLVGSLIAAYANIPAKSIQEGTLTAAEYSAYVKAAGVVGSLPIWIDDTKVTPRQMAAKVRKLQYRRGVDLVMVDYVQLMKAPAGVKSDEYERVTAISIELAELTKSLNVPILAAAQLNREADNRSDKRPQMSDLRSSGQLEQDAAVVMFPFRPAFYEPEAKPGGHQEAEIGIAKNRFGPTGVIRCAFNPVLKKFVPTQAINLTDLSEGKTA